MKTFVQQSLAIGFVASKDSGNIARDPPLLDGLPRESFQRFKHQQSARRWNTVTVGNAVILGPFASLVFWPKSRLVCRQSHWDQDELAIVVDCSTAEGFGGAGSKLLTIPHLAGFKRLRGNGSAKSGRLLDGCRPSLRASCQILVRNPLVLVCPTRLNDIQILERDPICEVSI